MDYSKLIEEIKKEVNTKFETKFPDNLYCKAQAAGANMVKEMIKFKIELFESLNK